MQFIAGISMLLMEIFAPISNFYNIELTCCSQYRTLTIDCNMSIHSNVFFGEVVLSFLAYYKR